MKIHFNVQELKIYLSRLQKFQKMFSDNQMIKFLLSMITMT